MFNRKNKKYYKELEENKDVVLDVLKTEKVKFNRTLEKGLKEFEKIINKVEGKTLDKEIYEQKGENIWIAKNANKDFVLTH